MVNAKLNKYGYIVNKNDLTKDQINMIISDLNIEPKLDSRFTISDNKICIYMESLNGDKFILPRYYGIKKFGIPSNIKFFNNFDNINIQFKGTLRNYQEDIIDIISKEYFDIVDNQKIKKLYGGSIISIAPGKGKTVLAIKLITQLQVKTLVVVHKTFLLNQWTERIKQYTNADIGIIQQDKIDINNKHIVIAMLQSIVLKDYDKELFSAFPFVIYDECHHLGAKLFSKSLMKVNAPYYLGLSATPERKDKLENIFKYFLGDIKYRNTNVENTDVEVSIYDFSIEHKLFIPLKNNFKKMYKQPEMITNLCKINERNDLIVSIINNILDKEPTRKILLLSGRCNDTSCNHLKLLSDKLTNYSRGYYKGGMKQIQLELSSEKQIILGTYSMAQEGLDISSLDTLILATPLVGDITQTCGRILRGNNINKPLIIDINDKLLPFSNQFSNRLKYYKKCNYKCIFNNKKENDDDDDEKDNDNND